MCEKIKISVGVVTFNSENEIDILMPSLKNSNLFNETEVYVVDNASSDNTANLISEKYSWAKLTRNEKNIGFGRAHNIIIREVKSKYHLIINPDVKISSDTLEKSMEFMDNHPDVVLMTPYIMNIDGTQQFLPKKNPSFKYLFGGMFEKQFEFCKRLREEYTMKNENITKFTDVEFCTGAFMFTRTEALKKLGGFDERYFLHFEDADLTRELKKFGRTVFNPEIKITHKWQRDNKKLNKSFFAALNSMFKYMIKWSLKK